ncbi:alpha/beta hydrolase family protein [Hydrogenivirga caldilitoris]|uniref:Alpha/beta hydrolase family protein n=1 Tax=Hydrogenivirga caldilitoris TaxID=246264 RepID=A0A497XPD3_9AQUI|nr:alpha/beta hydrolase [Hydrogenivirga caldilitoris]RLJ70805.1 alpha/beta hydrolase family protein [Hydrogenivirga caldilitoris]
MRGLLFLIVFLYVFSFGKPVSIDIDFEGRKLKANAEWVVPEGVDPKEKGAVLWLHGLFQTYSMREPIAQQRELWVSAGFPVLSPTLTLGRSDRKEPYDCSYPIDNPYELNIREIKEWIKWLKAQGVKKIVLAGHSIGGQQVIHTAEEMKGDKSIVALLAVAPAKGIPREHPLLKEAEKLVKTGKGKTFLETSFFYCQKVKVSARTLYTYYGLDRNIGVSLQRLGIPVLVVAGGMDDRVKDLPDFLNPYIENKKNVRLEVIDYADHFFRDLAAEDLSAIAVEFFTEVLK